MKKGVILGLLATSLVLAGCGKSGQDLSFSDAYNTLMKPITAIEIAQPNIDATKPMLDNENITFTLTSPSGFSASGNILSSGSYNALSGESLINITLTGKVYEPSVGKNIDLDALLTLVNQQKNIYGYIHSFTFRPVDSDNNESMIPVLVNTIANKWIQLSTNSTGETTLTGSTSENLLPLDSSVLQTTSFATPFALNISYFVSTLQEALKTSQLFSPTEQTKIDGDNAYAIAWNKEGIETFVHKLLSSESFNNSVTFTPEEIEKVVADIVAIPLNGHIIIHSQTDIELRISSMQINNNTLALTYSTKNGISWSQNASGGTAVWNGAITLDGKNILINASESQSNLKISATLPMQNGKKQFSIISPEITAQFLRDSSLKNSEASILPIITGATSLQNILQGFGLVGSQF